MEENLNEREEEESHVVIKIKRRKQKSGKRKTKTEVKWRVKQVENRTDDRTQVAVVVVVAVERSDYYQQQQQQQQEGRDGRRSEKTRNGNKVLRCSARATCLFLLLLHHVSFSSSLSIVQV